MDSSLIRVALDTAYAGVNTTGVGLYSRQLNRHLARIAATEGIRLRCYGPSCRPVSGADRIGAITQEWPTYTQGVLPLLLSAYRPHVIHSTSHIGPLLAPGRLIVTVHDLIFLRYPAEYNPVWLAITKALLPRVLQKCTAIIADSAATKSDLVRLLGVSSANVHVVYPGVDDIFRVPPSPDGTAQLRRRFGLGGDPYILCLGPWVRRKNLGVALQAFSTLLPQFREARLVITGRASRGMKKESPLLLNSLPSSVLGRVHIVGHVTQNELHSLLSGAALLAYPSRYEGFGLPPVEAMAAGVPVVASNTPAVAEVTAGAALLASPDSPDEWAAKFLLILSDSESAAQIIAAGRERSARFTWERCARETVQIYKLVAGPE